MCVRVSVWGRGVNRGGELSGGAEWGMGLMVSNTRVYSSVGFCSSWYSYPVLCSIASSLCKCPKAREHCIRMDTSKRE